MTTRSITYLNEGDWHIERDHHGYRDYIRDNIAMVLIHVSKKNKWSQASITILGHLILVLAMTTSTASKLLQVKIEKKKVTGIADRNELGLAVCARQFTSNLKLIFNNFEDGNKKNMSFELQYK
ncbi:hypothetical protein ACJX0J_038775 [Zea mays]